MTGSLLAPRATFRGLEASGTARVLGRPRTNGGPGTEVGHGAGSEPEHRRAAAPDRAGARRRDRDLEPRSMVCSPK